MAIADSPNYYKQKKINEEAFFTILKQFSPDLFVLIKLIIDEKLSPSVFWKMARQLININLGTGYGDIHILIENKVIKFINSTEKNKINETIVKSDA